MTVHSARGPMIGTAVIAPSAVAAAPSAVAAVRNATERGRRARVIVGPRQAQTPITLSSRQQDYLRVRKWIDALLAGLGLLIAALPMLAIAAGVALALGRPVLFTQERMTQDGRIFRLRKFRSMKAMAPDGSDDDAARLVPFGRFLRASSLDELPSLWNVLLGDMSLVGPRPLTTDYYGRFSADQFSRHAVPAGLTGYAQINGRNTLGWDDRLVMDQEYVERVGPIMDLKILLGTVTTVLRRHGVTDESGVTMADFPGPQSTYELELDGPDDRGDWACQDRKGRIVLEGTVQRYGADIAQLELRLGTRAQGDDVDVDLDPGLLDESILLLVSRLRVTHGAEWGHLAPGVELPAPLAAALSRAGFVTPGSAVRYPTHEPLPELPPEALSPAQTGPAAAVPPLIAFLGLPEESFARLYPPSYDPKVRPE